MTSSSGPPDDHLVARLGVGVLASPADWAVAGDDIGLTRGDGCFDATHFVRSPDGAVRIAHLEAHLARFIRSAAALELPAPDLGAWRRLIDEALAQWPGTGEGVVRLILTRGREGIPGQPPTGILTVAPLGRSSIEAREGISVVTLARGTASDAYADAPWLLGGVKTIAYAVNVAAAREAARRGADDVLFVSTDGYVLEAPRSACVWLTDGGDVDDGGAGEGEPQQHGVWTTTPHGGTGILASVTQAAAFAAAQADGQRTAYALGTVDDLRAARGVWLLSAGRLVAPVLRLDGVALRHDPELTARLSRWADTEDAATPVWE